MFHSLVRVSRRAADNHYANIQANAVLGPNWLYCVRGYNSPRRVSHSSNLYPTVKNRCWPVYKQVNSSNDERNVYNQVWLQALPFQQFHVLFHSLSKVLFIFRSLYLCAIGLWPIFSFRWNLPPILSCIPKQLDSSKDIHIALSFSNIRGSHPPRRSVPGNLYQ
jgi:hypothetical protein